jgi:hypothetical protein
MDPSARKRRLETAWNRLPVSQPVDCRCIDLATPIPSYEVVDIPAKNNTQHVLPKRRCPLSYRNASHRRRQ